MTSPRPANNGPNQPAAQPSITTPAAHVALTGSSLQSSPSGLPIADAPPRVVGGDTAVAQLEADEASAPDSGELAAAAAASPFASGRVLRRRPAVSIEASGMSTLIRAAVTAGTGGAIIALVSMAFGPRFFVADIRILGMSVGLAILALAAVSPIGPDARKTSLGALIIVAAIVGFPIAAGGYFIGSIIAVIGGAMLVAYEPPKGDIFVVLSRAGRLRRLIALCIDVVCAFILQRILFSLAPNFFTSTANVLVAWAFCWVAIAVVPAMWTRRTIGRLLMMLRISDLGDGSRAATGATFAREGRPGRDRSRQFHCRSAVRASQRTQPGGRPRSGLAGLGVFGLVIETTQLLDRFTKTTSASEALVVEPRDPVEATAPDDQ